MEKNHHEEESSLENIAKNVENVIDKKMSKLARWWMVDKFIKTKLMNGVIESKIVKDINIKIKPSLWVIFKIIWRISIIAWIIWVFSFLVSLTWIGFMFSFGVWVGIRIFIYVLITFWISLLTLISWIWMTKLKKRTPFFSILWFWLSVISLLISIIPTWFYSYKSYGNFGSALFNLILIFVLLVVILKNEDMFKN